MKVLLLEDTELVFVCIPVISQKRLLQRKNLMSSHFVFCLSMWLSSHVDLPRCHLPHDTVKGSGPEWSRCQNELNKSPFFCKSLDCWYFKKSDRKLTNTSTEIKVLKFLSNKQRITDFLRYIEATQCIKCSFWKVLLTKAMSWESN